MDRVIITTSKMLRDIWFEISVSKRNSPVRTICFDVIGYLKLIDLSVSSGVRAPGSSDAPKDPDHDDDDDDKGGMSGGAIGGIVIGVIIPIIVVAIIVVKLRKRGRVPKNQPVQPVAAPPAVVSYNAPTPAYSPYGPEPGVPVHSTRIAMPQPSYDQTVSPAVQASAPPYNPYYKGVSAL